MTRRAQSGFTLLETILSLALTAIIIGMLATLSRQWLSTWSLGADRMEYIESVTLAETRIASDIKGALAFLRRADNPAPHFTGSQNTIAFISEPRAQDGSNRFVAIRYQSDKERGILRSVALYNPKIPLDAQPYSQGVTLLPALYELSLSYRDAEGTTRDEWQMIDMPDSVVFAITRNQDKTLGTYAVSLRTQFPAICSRTATLKDCRAQAQSVKSASPLMPQGQSAPQSGKTTP